MKWPDRLELFCERVPLRGRETFTGVYFVVRGGDVLYVGQSCDVLDHRLSAARQRHGPEFSIFVFRMPATSDVSARIQVESAFIDLFQPTKNKARPVPVEWAKQLAVSLAGVNAPTTSANRAPAAPIPETRAPLTARQRQILTFIAAEIESGLPPTIREIGEATGIASTNGVNDHLKALERKGVLIRQERARGLFLTAIGRAMVRLDRAGGDWAPRGAA